MTLSVESVVTGAVSSILIVFEIVVLSLGRPFLAGCYAAHRWFSLLRLFMAQLQSTQKLIKSRTESFDCCEYIKESVSSFRKVPAHLTVILGTEEPSYDDLVKFIVWCLPAGVTHFSVYDHENRLDDKRLFDSISSVGRQYIPKIKWGKSFGEDIKRMSSKQINGYSWAPVLTIHIYRKEDGHVPIMQAVKDVQTEGRHHMEMDELNARLRKEFLAPDPDLAIVCGQILCTYGFPPWHLRITQIQILRSHHNLSSSKFLHLLHQYSNCEQRYGK